MMLGNSPIKTPKDLEGKTVAMTAGSAVFQQWPAFVKGAGIDDALSFINARPRPLALYYFDRNKHRIKKLLEHTVSGGVTINDCIFHFIQHQLPFGGVGPSGIGAYHGFDGFVAFSKKKGVLLQNPLVASLLDRLKPPYTLLSDRAIGLLVGQNKNRPIQRMTLR